MAYIDALDAKLRRSAEYQIGNGVVPLQFKNTTHDVVETSADLMHAFGHNAVIRTLSEYEASRCRTH